MTLGGVQSNGNSRNGRQQRPRAGVPPKGPAPPSPLLVAALRYADLGYHVFPCVPDEKKPLTLHGLKDATTDPEQIERWWTESPNANIAIRTEGLLVVDVDGAENPWLSSNDRSLELAIAPTAQTPRDGRHLWFRQLPGSARRCTQGKLADHVDTRADGGYVVAPPSCIGDRTYRWLEGYGLEVGPDQLPLPPSWLVAELLHITSKSKPTNCTVVVDHRIPEGRRNGTLTSYAGTMRRAGMTQPAIAAALQQTNTDLCTPPLPHHEVARIATSVARYAPEGRFMEMPEIPLPPPLTVRQLVSRYEALRKPLIHGLLRRGETMNVVSVPKLGKSWLVLDLALAIASGGKWLDLFQTERGNVLILDNELHGETSAQRIPMVAKARGMDFDAFADRVSIQNLRGSLKDIFTLRPYFESIQPGQYDVIILDAFYRFMPSKMDENDNGTMSNLYNTLDLYANHVGCSFVLIHHTTKGSQATKSVTDVGAGAGSQSRATDTHLILRPHQEVNGAVLDAVVRSWPPVTPLSLRWAFPVWMRADDLDPTHLRIERRQRSPKNVKPQKVVPTPWTVERFVKEFLSETPKSKPELQLTAKGSPGLSGRNVTDFIGIAEERSLIWSSRSRIGGQKLYSTVKPEEPTP